MTHTQTNPIIHIEVWYQVQYSYHGADDWFTNSPTFDTVQAARESIRTAFTGPEAYNRASAFDFRVVRKTLTEETI